MALPELILLLANVVYATSYVATRIVLDDVPPLTLALLRLVIGVLVLVVVARGRIALAASSGDRWRIAGMGLFGFAAAFAFTHWGIARSTATNAALLIVVEPLTILLASPVLLDERLDRREGLGAALGLTGAVLVVAGGVPGLSAHLVPYWRGDLLLMLAGIAYASYTLFGREVLVRHDALRVTTQSMMWGLSTMLPLAAMEWGQGRRVVWSAAAVLGTGYLALVITALGYLLWNWALARVAAPRAAIFLNVQPVVGALLGVTLLGDPLSVFTVSGGALVVTGLWLTVKREP